MQTPPNSDYNSDGRLRRALTRAALVLLLAALVWPVSAGPQTAPAAVVVGRLYGDDVTVKGAVSFESMYGIRTALLSSGSDVTVNSGRAQIELMHGGNVAICGPAHFTLLESGGAITLALDYGKVRPQVEAQVALTVYTPMIVATPVAIGTNPRDLTVGLDQQGAMCTLTSRGAARIQQQLTGESVLAPQGGEITLNGGQLGTLQSVNGNCDCELLVTRNMAPKSIELSRPVPMPATRPQPAAPVPPPPAEQPIYRVYLPPLSFNANAPNEEPDPDPAHILMVRLPEPLADPNFAERTEPTEAGASDYISPAPAVMATVAEPPVVVKVSAPAAQAKRPNVFARFFGAIFGRRGNRCVGAGCGDAGN
jgi:hypothetical protein